MQTKQQKNMHIARRVQGSRDQPSRDSFVVHAFAEIGRLEFAQMQTNTHTHRKQSGGNVWRRIHLAGVLLVDTLRF